MSDTSIGNGPERGGNENHSGDPRRKTMGESAPADEPALGADVVGDAMPLPPPPMPTAEKGS